jgi:hypothetical protein
MVEGETKADIALEATDDVPVLVEPVAPPKPAPPRMSIDQVNDPARCPVPQHWLRGPPEVWPAYLHWFV